MSACCFKPAEDAAEPEPADANPEPDSQAWVSSSSLSEISLSRPVGRLDLSGPVSLSRRPSEDYESSHAAGDRTPVQGEQDVVSPHVTRGLMRLPSIDAGSADPMAVFAHADVIADDDEADVEGAEPAKPPPLAAAAAGGAPSMSFGALASTKVLANKKIRTHRLTRHVSVDPRAESGGTMMSDLKKVHEQSEPCTALASVRRSVSAAPASCRRSRRRR